MAEEGYQPLERRLVVADQRGRMSCPVCSERHVARGATRSGESPGSLDGASAQPSPLVLEPPLAFGPAGDEKAVEQIAPIELEGRRGVRHHGLIERNRVAPEAPSLHAKLLVAATLERAVAERLTQAVKCLTKGGTGMFLVELGPRQREQRIAPVKVPGPGPRRATRGARRT